MVWAILPLILGITYLIVLIGKEKFGYSVPISIILISLFLYFSQIAFSTFTIGIVLFIGLGIIGCVLGLASATSCIKYTGFKESKDLFFTPGLYGFIVVFLFALLIYGGRHFTSWDELSHWGLMVKEMVRLDRFYIIPEARHMAHKDYPPIIQIFEFLICKFAGGYSEGKASTGIQLVLLSFLVPSFMEKFGGVKAQALWKKALYNLLTGMLILTVTVLIFLWFDEEDVYKTIYNDCTVCAVAVFALGLVFDKNILTKRTRKVFVLLTLFYLALCKQIAIAFILLAIFEVFVLLVQEKGLKGKEKGLNILFMILMFVVPLASLKIWSYVIAPYNLGAQFDLSKIRISEVIRILIGRGAWLQHTTYMKYVASLLTQPVTTGFVSIGYATAGILAIFLLTVMYHHFKTDSVSPISKSVYIRYLIVFAAGIVGYAFTLFVMYMYGFSEVEMLRLASFPRYMATYVCSMYLLLFGLLLESKFRMNKYRVIATLLVLLLILVDQRMLTGFLPKVLGNEKQQYQSIAQDIDAHVEYDDKVLLISDDNVTYHPFVRYFCDEALVYGDEYQGEVPADALSQYDYVYVININDSINELWQPLLADPASALETGIYTVYIDGSEYKLQKAN